jgi:hypothetical protein
VTRGAFAAALALATVSTLAACGGGGDDQNSPDANQADAVVGRVMVSGVVRYEDRAPLPNGSLAGPVPKPARFITVALVTLGGDTLGAAVTAADGSFSIMSSSDVPFGDSVHLLAATTSDDALRPIDVVHTNGNVHGFGGEGFEAAGDVYQEVLVTESSGEAGAFNIFDVLVTAADYVGEVGATPDHLTAVWQRGNQDGTYYSDFENTMYLLGASSDDDGYDDTVILHESGHWIEHTLGRSDNPGGFHDGSPADPNLAWSEGFSTYWAMVVNNGPIYVDTNAGGGWSFNADTSITRAMGSGIAQDISEDMVCEILWDLGDAPAADDDVFAGTHVPVVSVEPNYLRIATLRAIGESGVDLVDFLDGFFLADGLTHCEDVRTVVTGVHTFPYDYAGPAGLCP